MTSMREEVGNTYVPILPLLLSHRLGVERTARFYGNCLFARYGALA